MTRDYVAWHDAYDDPHSALSWRLRTVSQHLRTALDARTGPVRAVSACSGDGRDLLDVLHERDDSDRVSATLLEVHPGIAAAARERSQGLTGIDVRTADAGHSDAYEGAVPADIVIMVGIFGNISLDDVDRSVRAAPQFCAPDAMLLWSRRTGDDDVNGTIRGWFVQAGFAELAYDEITSTEGTAVGAMRYAGAPTPLVPGRRLFTFVR